MKTITITAYKRPVYLRKVLESLVRNDLRDWHVFIALEPSSMQEMVKQVIHANLKGQTYTIIENPERLGVEANPHNILTYVFENGSDINIYLEDDTIVSPDITRIANWYLTLDLEQILCLSLLAGNCGGIENVSYAKHPTVFGYTDKFNSLGWIATKKQWDKYISNFWFSDRILKTTWDWAVLRELQQRPYLKTIQPMMARANHIGRENGEHCTAGFHDKTFNHIIINDEPNVGEYRLTDW